MAANGIAVVIPSADFSALNIGKVTFVGDLKLTGLEVIAENEYNNVQAQMNVRYIPSTTQQTGVTWKIVSGESYAKINATTGLITIFESANMSVVIVEATSIYDANIKASKAIIVTYAIEVDTLDNIDIIGDDNVTMEGYDYEIAYTPTNTAHKNVTWSIVEGGEYATINQDGRVTPIGVGSVVIKAVSDYNNNIFATKKITVTNIYEMKAVQFRGTTKNSYIVLDEFIPAAHGNMWMECEFYPILAGNVAASKDGKEIIAGMGSITPASWTHTDGLAFYVEEDGNLTAFYANTDITIEAGINLKDVVSLRIDSTGVSITKNTTVFTSWAVTPEVTNSALYFGLGAFMFRTGYKNTGTCRYSNIKIGIGDELIHYLVAYQTDDDYGYQDKVTGTKYSLKNISNTSYYDYITD